MSESISLLPTNIADVDGRPKEPKTAHIYAPAHNSATPVETLRPRGAGNEWHTNIRIKCSRCGMGLVRSVEQGKRPNDTVCYGCKVELEESGEWVCGKPR